MDYPFCMYGKIIKIYRYKVIYNRTIHKKVITDNNEISIEAKTIEKVNYFPTKTEAELLGDNITPLDTSAYEWLDNIEVDDVPDTFAEAVKIYEMGEEAYKKLISTPSPEEDLDAMIVSMAYDITLLQLGLE